jgi:hypothetical protein
VASRAFGSVRVVPDTVDVWEFDLEDHPGAIATAVLDRLVEPQFRAAILSTTGDTVTLQVVDGAPTDKHADTVFYVEGRGSFVVHRREEWPPVTGGTQRRILLVLRGWPSR